MENKELHWEKFGVYIAATAAILTFMIYIADIKERISKLEASSCLNERMAKLETQFDILNKPND